MKEATVYLKEGGKRLFATVEGPEGFQEKDGMVWFKDKAMRLHGVPFKDILRIEIISHDEVTHRESMGIIHGYADKINASAIPTES